MVTGVANFTFLKIEVPIIRIHEIPAASEGGRTHTLINLQPLIGEVPLPGEADSSFAELLLSFVTMIGSDGSEQ